MLLPRRPTHRARKRRAPNVPDLKADVGALENDRRSAMAGACQAEPSQNGRSEIYRIGRAVARCRITVRGPGSTRGEVLFCRRVTARPRVPAGRARRAALCRYGCDGSWRRDHRKPGLLPPEAGSEKGFVRAVARPRILRSRTPAHAFDGRRQHDATAARTRIGAGPDGAR